MFARTPRLTLRPGWIEDAPALHAAIAHRDVVTKLARAPWPYSLDNALQFLEQPTPADELFCVIAAHDGGAQPRLIGAIGVHRAGGDHEIGYWLTPTAWGRGYATEAGRAVVDMARWSLGIRRLNSGHFVDNPASGRVLRKLGFAPTGRIERRECVARGGTVGCATYALELADVDDGTDRLAA